MNGQHLFEPDLKHAREFLDILAGGGSVTFQTFSDREELRLTLPNAKPRDPNARILHGTLEQHSATLKTFNTKGAGVYAMVNEGNSKGRTAKNVLRVRALFIDTDGAPLPIDTPLKPHLKVQSSPGKYHLYWLVSGLDLADFSTLQQALAEHYGTDLAVKDLPRVMRLPGFYHYKAEPVMVQLLEAHDHPPYSPADVFHAWPFLSEKLDHKKELEAEHQHQQAEIIKRAAERRANPVAVTDERARAEKLLQAHHDTVACAGEGTRNPTLCRAAYTLGGYVATGYLDIPEVESVLLAAAIVSGLSEGEARELIPRALRKGMGEPLALGMNPPFDAGASLDANLFAPKQSRAAQCKPSLVQLCNDAKVRPRLGISNYPGTAGRPKLGGKPCL